jgi:hypothetical protein
MERIVFRSPQGSVPPNYVQVSRWADASEVELWKKVNSHIPLEVARGNQIYVTTPGAKRPGGTGSFRIDFFIPKQLIMPGSRPDWKQIFGPIANAPIYNITIFATS